jgi:hypothetical protein
MASAFWSVSGARTGRSRCVGSHLGEMEHRARACMPTEEKNKAIVTIFAQVENEAFSADYSLLRVILPEDVEKQLADTLPFLWSRT